MEPSFRSYDVSSGVYGVHTDLTTGKQANNSITLDPAISGWRKDRVSQVIFLMIMLEPHLHLRFAIANFLACHLQVFKFRSQMFVFSETIAAKLVLFQHHALCSVPFRICASRSVPTPSEKFLPVRPSKPFRPHTNLHLFYQKPQTADRISHCKNAITNAALKGPSNCALFG